MISLILGILQALGPMGKDKTTVAMAEIWNDIVSGGHGRGVARGFSNGEALEQELQETAVKLAVYAGSYYQGGSEVSFIKREPSVLQATFEPQQVGEIMLGQEHDLAVVEVLGVNVERLRGGQIRREKGALLIGMVLNDGEWHLQNAYWYPQKQDIEQKARII